MTMTASTTQARCPSGHSAAEHDALMDRLADVVVLTAFAAHPGDQAAAIEAALAFVDTLMVPTLLEECGHPGRSDRPVTIGTWVPGLHGDDEGQAAREFDLIEKGEL